MLLLRHAKGVARQHDAKLFSLRAGDTHLTDMDFLIDSQRFPAYGKNTSWFGCTQNAIRQ